MTEVQIYLLVAPIVLLLISVLAAYWWLHRPYPEDGRHKSH